MNKKPPRTVESDLAGPKKKFYLGLGGLGVRLRVRPKGSVHFGQTPPCVNNKKREVESAKKKQYESARAHEQNLKKNQKEKITRNTYHLGKDKQRVFGGVKRKISHITFFAGWGKEVPLPFFPSKLLFHP